MAILAKLDRCRQQWYLQAKPPGASEENKNRALALCNMRQNKMRREEPARDTLWDLAKQHDPEGRRWKSRNVLHNREFLITLILDGEQRQDAVPPSWREPRDDLCNGRKRSRTVAFVEAAVPVQPSVLDFDGFVTVADKLRRHDGPETVIEKPREQCCAALLAYSRTALVKSGVQSLKQVCFRLL